jgi:Fe-S cluster assembly ATP-binding protein
MELKIDQLCAGITGKEILHNVTMHFKSGQVHAIMGRNGCGKSTLSKVLAGHPDYEVTSGSITWINNQGEAIDVLALEPEERTQLGLFIGFQSPIAINGLDNESFLRTVYNTIQEAKGQSRMDAIDFRAFILEKMANLSLGEQFLHRGVNSGFSGGERKKNEMLQLALLQPQLAFLDELDSGLDIDALATICHDLLSLKSQDNCFVLVTHYNRILQYVRPDFLHIMHAGQVVLSSSDADIAQEIEEQGFDQFIKEVQA